MACLRTATPLFQHNVVLTSLVKLLATAALGWAMLPHTSHTLQHLVQGMQAQRDLLSKQLTMRFCSILACALLVLW